MDIAAFSDEQLAGQRLMVGFDGTELNQDLMFLIDTLKVGGIILFYLPETCRMKTRLNSCVFRFRIIPGHAASRRFLLP